jgi:hypothetical protein
LRWSKTASVWRLAAFDLSEREREAEGGNGFGSSQLTGRESAVTQTGEESVVQTYAGLRLAMVFLVILLFASVAFQIRSAGCLQSSISAYYYTPVRPIFVAALCAIGACLIIYRGSTNPENVFLDFSGFLAFIVAFVPTQINRDACGTSNLPLPAEVSLAVRNNAGTVLLVGILAAVVAVWLSRGRYAETGRPSLSTMLSMCISLVALAAGFTFYLVSPARFERYGHEIAAVTLFLGILAVIIFNARDLRSTYRRAYSIVAFGMLAVAALLSLARWQFGSSFETFVFWLETELIFGFAVYWLIQTYELRGFVDRESLRLMQNRSRT